MSKYRIIADPRSPFLRRLHGFLVAIHNFRFQIDVLALKALLFGAQKVQFGADKALTESLTIAKPGGFIRPFVDLGSPMADLLKRLHRQRIAVDYVEKILAAFRDDEHTLALDTTGDESPSPTPPQLRLTSGA